MARPCCVLAPRVCEGGAGLEYGLRKLPGSLFVFHLAGFTGYFYLGPHTLIPATAFSVALRSVAPAKAGVH